MTSCLILSERKTPTYTSQRERVDNVIDGKRRRGLNKSLDKNFPSTKCQRTSLRADERVVVRVTSCPQDEKLSLKADEPHANCMKGLKGNGNTTTLLFSLKGLEILHKEKTIVMEHFNGILFQKFRPANKQHNKVMCLKLAQTSIWLLECSVNRAVQFENYQVKTYCKLDV